MLFLAAVVAASAALFTSIDPLAQLAAVTKTPPVKNENLRCDQVCHEGLKNCVECCKKQRNGVLYQTEKSGKRSYIGCNTGAIGTQSRYTGSFDRSDEVKTAGRFLPPDDPRAQETPEERSRREAREARAREAVQQQKPKTPTQVIDKPTWDRMQQSRGPGQSYYPIQDIPLDRTPYPDAEKPKSSGSWLGRAGGRALGVLCFFVCESTPAY